MYILKPLPWWPQSVSHLQEVFAQILRCAKTMHDFSICVTTTGRYVLRKQPSENASSSSKHQQQYPSHRFEITKPMQLSWTKLVQHAKSKLHQKASICNAGEDNLQNLPGLAGSPSHSEFAELIQEAKSPSTFQASCCREKRRAMLWTLAEAAMDIDRTCLQNAVSICLTQDASAGRLLVNVSASCTKLERRNHEKNNGNFTFVHI